MGNILGIKIPYDKVVSVFCGCFGEYNKYANNLEEKVDDLHTAMQILGELREDVIIGVSVCEISGMQPLATVQGWLRRVADTNEKVTTLLQQKDQEIDRSCVCGYCSTNCVSSYKYGKQVVKKLAKVNGLISEGDFSEVGQEGPRPVVDERPIRLTVGRNATVDNIWSSVMENTFSILGLYGMGGVGKTTLLTCINNKFLNAPNDYDIVIWVSVSREVQIQRIQDDIGKKLGLFNESWERLRQEEKALGILRRLKDKKFFLLLDDIWTRLDLTELGVPVPNAENGCKIIFNTRFHNICGLMGADRTIAVKCLEWNDAWELFQIKAGRKILENDAGIFQYAQGIARKCQGLPLALTAIGVSMRSKETEEEWESALDDLATSMTTDAENVILPLLKFSFDAIKDEKTQSSFLFCALLPVEDYAVEKDELVDYWIGEGIIEGFGDRNRAIKSGHKIIHKLVNACLLIEDGSRNVKMHDVIRQMALWVASDSNRDTGYSVVRTHDRVDDILEVENPKEVTRISLMNNEVVDLTSYAFPKLKTLIARRNGCLSTRSEFFQSLQFLKVLDLSENQGLESLPEDISELVSLEHLNLSNTSLKRLPKSFKELVKLKYLNLEYTYQCEEISEVSNLHNLQTLRLYDCGFFLLDRSGSILFLETLAKLKLLKVLTVCIDGADALEMLLNSYRLTNSVRLLSVYEYHSNSFEISSLTKMSGLESLDISNSNVKEIEVDVQTAQELRKLSRNIIFRNLYSVMIHVCHNLQHLTWLLLAPNLTHLSLYVSNQLEEVIREAKIESIIDQPIVHVQPFQKLKELGLMFMPRLRSIYEIPLPFPCLEIIEVVGCPKLKKLPLDSESAKGQKLVIKGSEEWIKNIEWKDEATKKAFTLSYKE